MFNFFPLSDLLDTEKQISVRNCLGIQSLAKAMSCPELEETARIFAMQHFPEVCASDEILHLNKNELVSYLSSDDLNARVEEPVYEVAIRWLRHENGRMKVFHSPLPSTLLRRSGRLGFATVSVSLSVTYFF